MSYIDLTKDQNYPKTLKIRNHEGGAIWQLYHVQKESEAVKLSHNATSNGFEAISLEDYQPEYVETWPDWRETCDPSILL